MAICHASYACQPIGIVKFFFIVFMILWCCNLAACNCAKRTLIANTTNGVITVEKFKDNTNDVTCEWLIKGNISIIMKVMQAT